MRTKPIHECNRKEKRFHGHWPDVKWVHRNDPEARAELYALDDRLDTKGYALELAALRRAIRNAIGRMIYKMRGHGVTYDRLVHVHVAEVDDPVFPFEARVSLDEKEIEGYEMIGAFPVGDAHSMQPDQARDDRMYRHFLWPRHQHKAG